MQGFIKGNPSWLFPEKWEDKGIITIPNMLDKGSMSDAPGLEEVYHLGRNL